MNFMSGRALLLGVVFLLFSCATLLGPRQVNIPLERLQEAVAKKFPFNSRYLELFDITVSHPQVSLQPETNRILTSFDASIVPPFLRSGWNGSFTVSGTLRFDAVRNALVLAEPRMEQFNIQGLDNRYASQISRIGKLIAGQWLQDTLLYTFSPEDLRYAGTRYTLSKITTTANGLVITFDPLK